MNKDKDEEIFKTFKDVPAGAQLLDHWTTPKDLKVDYDYKPESGVPAEDSDD